jgi:hypothetical protein
LLVLIFAGTILSQLYSVQSSYFSGNGYACTECHAYPCGGIYYPVCPTCKGLSNNPYVNRRDYLCFNCAKERDKCKCNKQYNSSTDIPGQRNKPPRIVSATPIPSAPPDDKCLCCNGLCFTCNYLHQCNCCRIFCKCQSNTCRNCWSFGCCKCWTCRLCACRRCGCCRCCNCCKSITHFNNHSN